MSNPFRDQEKFMKSCDQSVDQFNEKHMVELPMDVSEALNIYDTKNNKLDPEGNWQDLVSIPEFIENSTDELTHAPAAVDKNHIVLENPENKKIEVINVVPREHWDTIHDPKQEDQEDGQGFIKRADD
jgi:hypothetical protein